MFKNKSVNKENINKLIKKEIRRIKDPQKKHIEPSFIGL